MCLNSVGILFSCITGAKAQFLQNCYFFGTEDEYTMHICRCKKLGRDSMFRISVKEIYAWLVETLGEYSVAVTVETYLLAQGQAKMVNCVYGNNENLIEVTKISDCLSWDSFLEGRISSHWLAVSTPCISRGSQHLLPTALGHQFITRLHKIVRSGCILITSFTTRGRTV